MRFLIISHYAWKLPLRFDGRDHEYHFCSSPNQIPGALDAFRPQLIVLDDEALGKNPTNILHETKQLASPFTYLVSLTRQTSTNEMCQRMSVDALLHPDDGLEQTVALLQAYQKRQTFISSGVLSHIECPMAQRNNLSKRERQVLDLIWQDKPCSQIANQLNLSTETVKNHRKAIKRKLKLHGSKSGLLNFKKLYEIVLAAHGA